MILDSEEVVLNETQDVDEIITEYCLLPSGTSPSSSTTWYTIDNLPTYIDNVGGTQYVYWMRQTINGYTNDPTPVKKTLISTQLKDNGLTTSGKTAAMVRQYGAGVLVCRKGKTVGALVNADGSFDVVQVSWSSDTPTAGAVLASYGNKLMVMKDNEGSEYLRLEDLRNSSGRLTVKEKIKANAGKYLIPSYDIYSVTSVVHTSDSAAITNYTNTALHIQSSSLVVGDVYTVTYVSDDYSLKAYTFGSRSSGSKGAQSFSVGEQNKVTGVESIAFGDNNNVTGDHSLAIGSSNTISKDWAVVIGNMSSANRDGQVVIGDGATPVSSHKFELVEGGTILFSVNATNGGIITRNPNNNNYGYICSGQDATSEFLFLDLYNNAGTRTKRIMLRDTNVLVDGVKQFYESGDSLTLNSTSPYSAYVTDSSKTLRITIPLGKSLQFINVINVESMIGAIIGPNGYLNLPGETSVGSHSTQWDGAGTITATKIDNYTIRVQIAAGTAFYNTTNNRPHMYIPSYGGITFNFYDS